MRALALSLAAVALAGCVHGPAAQVPVPVPPIASVAKAVTVPVKRVCPRKTYWSDAQMDKLAGAMSAVPEFSPIWDLERDWQLMRDQADACAKAPAGK